MKQRIQIRIRRLAFALTAAAVLWTAGAAPVQAAENMEICYAQEEEETPAPEGINVKGALVLGGGYLAAMAVFLIYILVHMKTKAGQQEADGTETKEKEKNSEGQHADS